ncbi:MAG: DUF1292 domain-containing protein [Butyrivibrio sp.]|uniref:DUF1292 domain-containing protein n=1 Tax=Butyrivibrio sp. TaxID=28121 RepID=UPI0025D3D639|nr:DUF1292 domain-containing protein [Butyrivibrio sp.]MCR5770432.1 DUF1292 domain-containing protein [Butyrivibrio sp.]
MEKITLNIDGEGTQDFYALEQTVVAGKTYLLVTDSEEGDGDAFILRDDSDNKDSEALYSIVDDDQELKAVGQIFVKLLDEDGIELDL